MKNILNQTSKNMNKQSSEVVWLTVFCEENDIPLSTMRYLITKGEGVVTFKIGRRRFLTRAEGKKWIARVQREYVETDIVISS